MGTRLASKLNVGDVSNPLAALARQNVAETDTKTIVWLGNIIGKANGLSYRSNNFGDEPSVALTGIFEPVPAFEGDDIVRAPSLFMPRAIQAMLVEAMRGSDPAPVQSVKKGTKLDVPGKEIKILFQVGCRRNSATGGAGYEFVTNQVGEIEKIDVLESLRAELATGKASPQLAAPAATPQIEKPAAEKPAPAKSTAAKKAPGKKR